MLVFMYEIFRHCAYMLNKFSYIVNSVDLHYHKSVGRYPEPGYSLLLETIDEKEMRLE